jgi:hypothetical protein
MIKTKKTTINAKNLKEIKDIIIYMQTKSCMMICETCACCDSEHSSCLLLRLKKLLNMRNRRKIVKLEESNLEIDKRATRYI